VKYIFGEKQSFFNVP